MLEKSLKPLKDIYNVSQKVNSIKTSNFRQKMRRERGMSTTLVPKVVLQFISFLNNLWDFIGFGWFILKLGVKTFQPLILNYKRGNFVC